MSERNYYQVLGVSRRATPAELRAAYVRLAKQHHPDRSRLGAELPQRLKDVQNAYRCLSDAERRTAHDRALDERERLHFRDQHALYRRLRRYDRRHPRRAPRMSPRRNWRALLAIALAVAVVVHVSLRLLG